MHRFPLLSLRRVHGGEHEVVLVEVRLARQVAGGLRRIERHLGEERGAIGELPGDLFQLQQVAGTHLCAVVETLEVRQVPLAHALHLPFPRRIGASISTEPVFSACHEPSASKRVNTRAAPAGPTPGRSCSARNAAMRFFGLSAQRSTASRSLTCAASRNLRPPYFTYGMLRLTSSSSSRSEWCEARNSTAWFLSSTPRSRASSTRVTTYAACPSSSATVT